MIRAHKKKLMLLGGYLVFNFFLTFACIRALTRIGSLFRISLSPGEIISGILALLLPSPF